MEENQLEKIKYIAETIKEKSYDVIAFQEVSQSIDENFIDNQIKKDNFAYVVLQELKSLGIDDYLCVWDFSHLAYHTFEEGLAILTKHPYFQANLFCFE